MNCNQEIRAGINLHYLLYKKIGIGAHGRLNMWSLQQIQFSTHNLPAKDSTTSNSSLETSQIIFVQEDFYCWKRINTRKTFTNEP